MRSDGEFGPDPMDVCEDRDFSKMENEVTRQYSSFMYLINNNLYSEQKILSNFQFLTAKPMLIVWNIGENNLGESQIIEDKLTSEFTRPKVGVVVVSGKWVCVVVYVWT